MRGLSIHFCLEITKIIFELSFVPPVIWVLLYCLLSEAPLFQHLVMFMFLLFAVLTPQEEEEDRITINFFEFVS